MVEELDLSPRTTSVLLNNRIKNVSEILEIGMPDLMRLQGIGRKVYEELNEKFKGLGLNLDKRIRLKDIKRFNIRR